MESLLKDKNLFVPRQIYEQVYKSLAVGNNVTLLWMPKFTRTGFGISLQSPNTLQELKLAKPFANNHFIYLDLNLELQELKDSTVMQVSKYAGKYSNLYDLLNQVTTKGDKLVFVFDNMRAEKTNLLQFFLSLKSINIDKIQFVFMLLESDFRQLKLNSSSLGPLFYNLIVVPYYTKAEAFELLDKHIVKKFSLEQKDRIFKYTGGISSILRNFIRCYEKYHDIELTLLSSEFKQTLLSVWGRFTAEEKEVLLKVTIKEADYNKEIFEYMGNHKLIVNGTVVGDWVAEMLAVEQKKLGFHINSRGVFYMNKSLSEILTKQEEQIIIALIKKDGFLTKQEIAEAIWGEESNEKYSEWAISKLFSNIREKLKLVGISPENIITIKGKGFKLNKLPK